AMACPQRSLAQVQERVSAVHHSSSLSQQICLYDDWAPEYEQDVRVLEYRAPQLAAACLAAAFSALPHEAVVLDVACGTGLVCQELQKWGFCRMHGMDGSMGMLERARRKGLYQELKQCILGQEPLPAPTGHYDAVIIVGALSVGQVPSSVIPELLRVTKPGGMVCLTTRYNMINLPYVAELRAVLDGLEQRGLWEKITVQEADEWERATSALASYSHRSSSAAGLSQCARRGHEAVST
uniref:Methyltransferase like 27 n=1 Tax=Pelusios castaneus TaxID=367368 RepID=A0A8C8VKX6_9SAUR